MGADEVHYERVELNPMGFTSTPLTRYTKYVGVSVLCMFFWIAVSVTYFVNDARYNWDPKYGYYIVCDAGSTGTRLYIYHIKQDGEIQAHRGTKKTPGLSSFYNYPEDTVEYLRPLLEKAVETGFIPEADLPNTQLFIRATAGMRLLDEKKQNAIYDAIVEGFPSLGLPFSLPRSHLSTISGDDEGYYALVAINYLMGRVDDKLVKSGGNLVGALDIGGSSTQIMFDPFPEDELQLRGGYSAINRDQFYSHSFLKFGAEIMRQRLDDYIAENSKEKVIGTDNETVVLNPCYFTGYKVQSNGVLMTGSGQAEECFTSLNNVIFGKDAEGCLTKLESKANCKIDGVNIPEITGQFYGMSLYYYAIDCMRVFLYHASEKGEENVLNKQEILDLETSWPHPDLLTIQRATKLFCSLSWTYLRDNLDGLHPITPTRKLPHRCFDVSLVISLLRSFGFDTREGYVTFSSSIKGIDIEWALGAFLEERANTQKEPVKVDYFLQVVYTLIRQLFFLFLFGCICLVLTYNIYRRGHLKARKRILQPKQSF